MESKCFGVLLENVIGYSCEDVIIDDQLATYDQKHLVVKGSLLTALSQQEAKATVGNINPLPNYKCVCSHLTIMLHCKPHQVLALTKNQRALLSGVPRENDRIKVLHNLDWVEKLHFGSYVYVTIPTISTPVRGVIYHIGSLDGVVGTHFGIELDERRGEGTHDGTFRGVDYFECDPNCAVFVSMDKLAQKRSTKAAKVATVTKQSPQPQDDKPLRLGDKVIVYDKDGHPITGIVRSVKKNVLGIEAEKHLAYYDVPGQVEDSKMRTDFIKVQHHHTKLFLPAHLVLRYDSHGVKPKVLYGGTKHGANESQRRKNSGMPNTSVGSHMNIHNITRKEIEKAGISPGNVDLAHQKMALELYEEEQKQKSTKLKKNKKKIKQQKRIQEAKDEVKMDDWSSLDDDWSSLHDDWSSLDTSLLDIEKQRKTFEEATHNKKMQEEKRLQEEIVQKIRLQEEEEEEVKRMQEATHQKRLQEKETAQQEREETAQQEREKTAKRRREETARQEREETAQQQRAEAARQKRVQEEVARQKKVQEEVARQKRVQEEVARQKRVQQEAAQQERLQNAQQNRNTCKTYAANDGNDSQSEEFYDTFDTWPDKQKNSPVDVAHVPGNHDDITFNDQFDPNHFANQPQENVTPVIKIHSSPQRGYKPTKPDLQPSNDNPHNLEVGTMIQFGNPPCYGVIKWIGSLPDTNFVMAGVELEAPIDGYTKYDDGWYGGKRLFESQINRGMFLPLKVLRPDRRFGSDDAEELRNHTSGILRTNTAVLHQDFTISRSQSEQLKNSGDELTTTSVIFNQIHQYVDKMEEKLCAVEEQMKNSIQKSEESVQRMEFNVDNAFQKALEVQKSNKELQTSSVDVCNQLSITQQQLSDMQKNNEHLQSQMSVILDKLSHTQQQLLDMQKSNEQLQTSNEQLQTTNVNLQNQLSLTQQQLSSVHKSNEVLNDQLSLTQQQLLGVQSMMTCSRLWVVSHDQFTIGREIGRGAWASVHECTFRGATVAAKCLHQLLNVPRTRQLFQREMEMALQCQHQNIVTFLGATLEGSPVILMELMDTNLRSAYEQGHIRDHQVLGILYDIASALHFLHTRPDPVIHRDVSSANVLLKTQYNGDWLTKLGDLGTAKIQQQAATAGPGAIAYGAPEAADFTKHSPKMDIYSYAVLILEILTKTHPFQIVDDLKVQVQQQFPQYHQLVTSCTNQKSSDRPTMYDVIGQLDRITRA